MIEMDENDIPPATPAATLVLFRDVPEGPPELLMVERSKGMRFAGGAVVFPGGRVDDDDHAIGSRFSHLDVEEAAARIAAIRETIEESLIPVGLIGSVSDDWLSHARTHLHAHKPFSELLNATSLDLDLDALVPFARWRPKHKEARVFDTRFYVARAPEDLPPPVVDDTENVRTFWASASHVIDLAAQDKVKVIYPTMRNLERLALFGGYDEALAHLETIELKMISPFMEVRADGNYLCIPDDQGYPVTAENLTAAVTAYDPKVTRTMTK
jgi:8-oxo-dGTP pyrophosphatase MutT (NUDIX family)